LIDFSNRKLFLYFNRRVDLVVEASRDLRTKENKFSFLFMHIYGGWCTRMMQWKLLI
jgi:hypothetical protein